MSPKRPLILAVGLATVLLALPAPGQEVTEVEVHEIKAEALADLLVPGELSRDLELLTRAARHKCELDVDWRERRAGRRPDPPLPLAVVGVRIEFPTDGDDLSPVARRAVEELGKALADPRLREHCFQIEGHTDGTGPRDHNLRLSLRRATTVTRYLSDSFGIEAGRLVSGGFGSQHPVARSSTAQGRQRNRRVTIVNLGPRTWD